MPGWKSVHYKRLEKTLQILSDACVDAVAEKPPPSVVVDKAPVEIVSDKTSAPSVPVSDSSPVHFEIPEGAVTSEFFKSAGWGSDPVQTEKPAQIPPAVPKPAPAPSAKVQPAAPKLPPVTTDEISSTVFFKDASWSGVSDKAAVPADADTKQEQPTSAEVSSTETTEYFGKAKWTADSGPAAKPHAPESRKLPPALEDETAANSFFNGASWSSPSAKGDTGQVSVSGDQSHPSTSEAPKLAANGFFAKANWSSTASDESSTSVIDDSIETGSFFQASSWVKPKAVSRSDVDSSASTLDNQPEANSFFGDAAWSAASAKSQHTGPAAAGEPQPIKVAAPRTAPPIPTKPMAPRPRVVKSAPRARPQAPAAAVSNVAEEAPVEPQDESLHMEISGNPEDAPTDAKAIPEHRNILFAGLMSAANTSKKILRNLSNSKNKNPDKE